MSKYIDKIIYINLSSRLDKKEQIENELNNFQLEYERFDAIDTPEYGAYGCGLSHIAVLKIAKEKNYKNVLILEDDFQFLVTKEEFENNLTAFFESNLDYNVCMLSYDLRKHIPIENNVVDKVVEAHTTSGYLIHSNYYDALINLFEKAMPLLIYTKLHWIFSIDVVWKDLQKKDNWYFFKTRIGKQRPGYSDVGKRYCNNGF